MHQALHLLMKGLTQDLVFLLGDLKNISRFLSVLTNPDSFLPFERRSKDLLCLLAITIGFQLTIQLVLLIILTLFCVVAGIITFQLLTCKNK